MLRAVPRIAPPSWVALLALATATAASGQEPTMPELALEWARGRYATPVICEFDGKPVRGIRRILIAPGPSRVQPPVLKVVFVDLEPESATRCFTELDSEAPNLVGSVQIRLPKGRRSDNPSRDFREQLRRKRGFEYEVVAGGLRITPVQQPPVPGRGASFRGGTALLSRLDPTSDLGRLLARFDSPRKLLLELRAPDGTELRFPLYLTDAR